MARQGWGVSIATAIGIAAGAGAAQLGFGYGLGVITWTPTEAGATDTAWADGLAWATWLAASSTVLGAVCAQRLQQRSAPATTDAAHPGGPAARRAHPSTGDGGLLRRIALALGAGIGGLVTVLLIAVPARVATGADTGAPQRTAAVQATAGILLGVLVALWALRSRAAATNVTATAAWLWLLAVVSVIDGVRVGRGLTGAQLGTWQLDPDHSRYWIGGQLYWPGALLALVPALLIGLLAARRAARSDGHRVGAAASGGAGPALVALAYLTTLPHWSTLGPAQLSTQLIAPYAMIAGIGGSVLAAVLAERAGRHRGGAAAARSGIEPAAVVPGPTAVPHPTTDPDPAVAAAVDPADDADPARPAAASSTNGPPAGAPSVGAPSVGSSSVGSSSAGSSSAGGSSASDSSAGVPAVGAPTAGGPPSGGTSVSARGRRGRSDATPPEATDTPRVPAPRTDPDHPSPTPSAEAATPAPRRSRANRRTAPN
ncbi:hypothetical protein O7634_09475 [Micromonospora sp. WMMD1120]|uniref:hypothetical protein n=1 Tax=Micromonospora sp. WMMD1120 TaxID=3016106 RepID=UPI00241731C1|nr:hypothetical protein [Micromonospora sp. WMMD1120]MDG4806981.1 hypothetical protein [Micromonospora sp. WMMD1120]